MQLFIILFSSYFVFKVVSNYRCIGKLDTPPLDEDGSFELIQPAFVTPQGDHVPVIELAWQVQGKLIAWYSRRKTSDFADIVFLCESYAAEIQQWSEHLDEAQRQLFYDVYKIEEPNEKKQRFMKGLLSL